MELVEKGIDAAFNPHRSPRRSSDSQGDSDSGLGQGTAETSFRPPITITGRQSTHQPKILSRAGDGVSTGVSSGVGVFVLAPFSSQASAELDSFVPRGLATTSLRNDDEHASTGSSDEYDDSDGIGEGGDSNLPHLRTGTGSHRHEDTGARVNGQLGRDSDSKDQDPSL